MQNQFMSHFIDKLIPTFILFLHFWCMFIYWVNHFAKYRVFLYFFFDFGVLKLECISFTSPSWSWHLALNCCHTWDHILTAGFSLLHLPQTRAGPHYKPHFQFPYVSDTTSVFISLSTLVSEQWWRISAPLTIAWFSIFCAIFWSNPGSRSGCSMTVTGSPRPNRKPAHSNPSADPPTTRARPGGWGRERRSSLGGERGRGQSIFVFRQLF